MIGVLSVLSLSLAIRSVGIFGRVVLIYLTAKQLTAEDLGFFNLTQSAIGIFTLVGGAEAVQYLIRDIARSSSRDHSTTVSAYLHMTSPLVILSATLFLVFMVTSLGDYGFKNYDYSFFILVVILYTAEHYNNECQRILIGLGKPISSNIVLLIRSGVWPCVAMSYYHLVGHISVLSIVIIWTIFSLSACFIAFQQLRLVVSIKLGILPSPDWVWKAIWLSTPILVGTLFQRSTFFLDKVFLNEQGLTVVGNYSILLSAALLLRMMFEASIIAYYLPFILKLDAWNFPSRKILNLYINSFLLLLAGAIVVYLARHNIFSLIGKDYLSNYSTALAILLSSIVAIGLSIPSSYTLIAFGRVLICGLCDVVYFCIFIAAILLCSDSSILSVSIAHFCGAIFMLTSKTALVFYVVRNSKVAA